MRTIDCKQRSSEWLAARAGKVTSSYVADVMTFLTRKSKNGGPGDESQARRNYKARLVAEILTGRCLENFVSDAMMHGIDYENEARAAYETTFDIDSELVGFVLHPTIDRAGASPDGLIGRDGLIEIKCPNTTTHLDYLLADAVPKDYQPQMLWQMACTGRQWCDFVSYDPRLPEHLQMFVKRFPRDDARISEMEKVVLQFLAEIDQLIAQLPRPDGTRPDLVPVLEQSLREATA